MRDLHIKFFLAIISLIAFDQLSKAIFLLSKKATLINDSGVFSLPIQPFIIVSIAILIIGLHVLVWRQEDSSAKHLHTSNLLNREKKLSVYKLLALVLLLSGGISNLIDRFVRGGVADIFSIYSLAFNSADIYIIGGGIVLLLLYSKQINGSHASKPPLN